MVTYKAAIKAAYRSACKHCYFTKQAFGRRATSGRSPAPVEASSTKQDDSEGEEAAMIPQITFDHDMTAIIKHNLSQNREMELEQALTSGKATAADKKVSKLYQTKTELQDKPTTATGRDPKCDDEVLQLVTELSTLDNQIKELEEEKKALKQHILWVERCQREVLRDVFDAIGEYCVEAGFMGAIDPAPMDEYLRMADEAHDLGTKTPAPTTVATAPKAQLEAEQDLDDTFSMYASSVPPEVATSQSPTPIVDQKEILRVDYRMARAWIRCAEDDFELREDRFDQTRAEHEDNADKDDSSAARLQLDLDELLETRRLARVLAEAEENFVKAKEACLAAGVDIAASDLSSGFLDNVNDGYRISEEKELIETVNPAGVASWLHQIPDDIGFESEHQDGLDIDDWDAQSVEIEDSASMVAEGSSRRRIDKWRTMCQEPTIADESAGLYSMGI